MLLLCALISPGGGHQVADIYDILTQKGPTRKLNQGTQYVVGVYREPPLHLKKEDSKVVSMTSGPGSKFTCHVPLSETERKEREKEGEISGTEENTDTSEPTTDEPPVTEPEAPPTPKPPPDPYAFLLSGLPTGCLIHNNGYWNYEICLKKGTVLQYHGKQRKPSFNLGRFRPGKLDPVVYPDFANLKPARKVANDFLLTQLVFDGGDDHRRSLVNVRCSARATKDGILKFDEPDMHVYVFDVHLRRACEYPRDGDTTLADGTVAASPGKPQGGPSGDPSGRPATVEGTLDNVFALIEAGPTQKPCLYYQPGWFTYEICYKKHVRQYHLDKVVSKDNPKKVDTKIVQEYSLGKWDGEEVASLPGSTPDKSLAMLSFVDGTTCDMTGKPRTTKLHFKCNKDIDGTRVETYQELQTCSYLFTLSTSALCELEDFKPETMSTEEIICYLSKPGVDLEESAR